MIEKISRLLNTLKYLQFKQLLYFIVRRRFAASPVEYNGVPEACDVFQLESPLFVTGLWSENNQFTFLNISQKLSLTSFNWCPDDVPRLWRYNLHYFDYLRQGDRSNDDKLQLLESWVANNPQGSQPGWEPFTASLRIVNWVFYLQQNRDSQTPAIMQSLYTQVLWLEKNDERHILANHYFENLKALTFAGMIFKSKDAERWLAKGIAGIREQLVEQTLDDGGHYERTPQYHGLMLENYLDLYNLVCNNPEQFSDDFIELLKQHCIKGLLFFQVIQFPDQQLPLFNDTAFGISPSLIKLDDYFQRLTTEQSCLPAEPDTLFNLQAFGLYGYRQGSDMFIIDAGDIGPSYQPGHTHCDMLSYELMLSDQRVVVDTGVCEYEPGSVRKHLRSTSAHNTVSVDGAEQSEVWGEFRVARRAKILSAQIQRPGNSILFDGAYQGFHQVKGRITHRRKVVVELITKLTTDETIQSLTVMDIISDRSSKAGSGGNGDTGGKQHRIESFIHLHPELTVTDQGGGVIKLLGEHGLCLHLVLESGVNYCLEESYYCPEFGVKMPNIRVVLQKDCVLPCKLSYKIEKH